MKNPLMACQNVMEGIADAFQLIGFPGQDERVIETARTLHHRASAADASENRQRAAIARRKVDFIAHSIGVPKHDKILFRLPKAQKRAVEWRGLKQFEQCLVAGEIAGRIGKSEIEIFHDFQLILYLFCCLLKY